MCRGCVLMVRGFLFSRKDGKCGCLTPVACSYVHTRLYYEVESCLLRCWTCLRMTHEMLCTLTSCAWHASRTSCSFPVTTKLPWIKTVQVAYMLADQSSVAYFSGTFNGSLILMKILLWQVWPRTVLSRCLSGRITIWGKGHVFSPVEFLCAYKAFPIAFLCNGNPVASRNLFTSCDPFACCE